MKSNIAIVVGFVILWLFHVAVQLATMGLYRRLFGILYRNVSEAYAERISFWVITALWLSGIGYIINLTIR
jgi:hypothetical protein